MGTRLNVSFRSLLHLLRLTVYIWSLRLLHCYATTRLLRFYISWLSTHTMLYKLNIVITDIEFTFIKSSKTLWHLLWRRSTSIMTSSYKSTSTCYLTWISATSTSLRISTYFTYLGHNFKVIWHRVTLLPHDTSTWWHLHHVQDHLLTFFEPSSKKYYPVLPFSYLYLSGIGHRILQDPTHIQQYLCILRPVDYN